MIDGGKEIFCMTRFIFVRHGQSVGNLTGRFLGQYDGALTDLGRRQAERAAEFLRDERIDEAFASDLSRAYETGKIIAEPHGIIPVPDKALREISAGKWENEEFSKIEEIYGADFSVWQNDIMNARPTGGESVRELAERVTKEVWRLAALCDGKTVLVATHATPIRMLLREWVNIGALPDGPKWVSNASATTAVYDAGKHTVEVIKVSENSYLSGVETDLPPNV